jgi:hypothetical protein
MRILINFQHYGGWSVHCMAEDCKTSISPFLDVASLETLRRLLRHSGADEDEMQHFEHCIQAWGKGSVWIENLTEEGAHLLRIGQAVPEQIH